MRLERMQRALARTVIATCVVAGISCGQAPTDETAPRPNRILPIAGDGQTGAVGEQLANPLIVAVYDEKSLPIEGASVSFNVELGSGTISPQTVITNENGTALARWTLGSAGDQRASASVARPRTTPLRAIFFATAVTPSGGAPVPPARPVRIRGRTD